MRRSLARIGCWCGWMGIIGIPLHVTIGVFVYVGDLDETMTGSAWLVAILAYAAIGAALWRYRGAEGNPHSKS